MPEGYSMLVSADICDPALQNNHLLVIIDVYSSTASKLSKYGLFSGPYFPAFGLNTERYSVSLRIQSECGKMRTEKLRIWTLSTQCSDPEAFVIESTTSETLTKKFVETLARHGYLKMLKNLI